MKTYILKRHSRGNHSAEQVYFHGTTIFEGTKKECKQELVRMRKNYKEKYHNTSTNELIMDFVRYEMADIFFVKKQNNQISWA